MTKKRTSSPAWGHWKFLGPGPAKTESADAEDEDRAAFERELSRHDFRGGEIVRPFHIGEHFQPGLLAHQHFERDFAIFERRLVGAGSLWTQRERPRQDVGKLGVHAPNLGAIEAGRQQGYRRKTSAIGEDCARA